MLTANPNFPRCSSSRRNSSDSSASSSSLTYGNAAGAPLLASRGRESQKKASVLYTDSIHLKDMGKRGDAEASGYSTPGQIDNAAVTAIRHSGAVWETRTTYGPAGFRGLFSSPYVAACAAFSALGGLLFGYDQGVVSVILVMPQFLGRFDRITDAHPNSGFWKGLLTAMIELGAFIGALNQGWIADKISRKYSIVAAVCVFTVGSALQTGSVDYSMLVIARFIGGIGIGMLSMVAPL